MVTQPRPWGAHSSASSWEAAPASFRMKSPSQEEIDRAFVKGEVWFQVLDVWNKAIYEWIASCYWGFDVRGSFCVRCVMEIEQSKGTMAQVSQSMGGSQSMEGPTVRGSSGVKPMLWVHILRNLGNAANTNSGVWHQ